MQPFMGETTMSGCIKKRCSLFLLLSNFIPRGKALANFSMANSFD
ncbi:hypothetical protein [Moorena sp. SIO3E8]|nr:hypothetical protein [Moorena sp. SIO3E8]